MEFTRHLTQTPTTDVERDKVLQNPGFGTHFTDHQVIIDYKDGAWRNPRIEAYGPIMMDPAAAVLHYAQEIFEGLKAYRHADGSVWTFRPFENAKRMNRSAARLAMPQLPEDVFVQALKELVEIDQAWVPDGDGEALYLRPFTYASEVFLGVRPALEYSFRVIASPAANYFGGPLKPVSIWVSRNYARAAAGGTGAAKCGGNYAASLAPQLEAEAHGCSQSVFLDPLNDNAIEELGGMNVCFITKDNTLITPALSGSILEGVTRKSLLQLAQDHGLKVEERRITIDEWEEGINSGQITEVFACGTAAVITPIGELKDGDKVIPSPAKTDVTMALRQELLGIQTGVVEDRHNWLYQLV
ncbi:branched-chain amino acid aminotransferase [Micrococcoides hystricis]|uniref:branched-chain-amino-acid transaminase n=1 Tax=Micrococcoides hystricis TaxID=1572761 RepID=A0ABV6PC20_9MICC